MGKMKICRIQNRLWLLPLLWLVGCTPVLSQPVLPTLMPVAQMPAVETVAGVPAIVGEGLAAPPPTYTPLPTAVSLQPSPGPTSVSEQPTPQPSPTAVLTPTASPPIISSTDLPAADSGACRSAAALANVQPQWTVRPGPWPRPAPSSGLLGQMPDRGLKLIHLGFDVEGDPAAVGELLAMLERRQVQTTFFVLGSWVDTYPEWVQEFVRRGHELASHGYSHTDMRYLPEENLARELRSVESAVVELTGQSPRPWLRPPFGAYSEASLRAAYEAGYTTVIWSGSANDWRTGMDADEMCETLLFYGVPGGILYAHTNRADIVTAVDRFVGEMQAAGFTFVPLSVLMATDPAVWLQPAED